jgi:hypothetical protein
MKFNMDFPLNSLGQGKEQMKFKAGAKVSVTIDVDGCIDASSNNGTTKINMTITGVADGPNNTTANLSIVMEGTEQHEDVPKK